MDVPYSKSHATMSLYVQRTFYPFYDTLVSFFIIIDRCATFCVVENAAVAESALRGAALWQFNESLWRSPRYPPDT